jgi:hypothetical protein
MDIKNKLSALFPADDVEWKVQVSGMSNGTVWAMVVPYVKADAIAERFDDVFTPAGWKKEYREWKGGKAQLCGISVKFGGEWVTKWDGAEDTDYEPVKGGLSDSFKRSARIWGVGRYLTKVEPQFAKVSMEVERGKGWHSAVIKNGTKKVKYWWKEPDHWSVPTPKISKALADKLMIACENKGIDLKEYLSVFRIDVAYDLTHEQYETIINTIKRKEQNVSS